MSSHDNFLFFLLGLIFLVGIRPFWNLIVWNKIYKTNYIPGFSKFKKDEMNTNVYCVLIFWWLKKEDDSSEITLYKKIGNWISVSSVILAAFYIFFFWNGLST